MMSKEETEIVKIVYTRFLECESDSRSSEDSVATWGGVDDNLEFVSFLSDGELISESSTKFDGHCNGILRCASNHAQENCFAPRIFDAVEAILNLYEKTGLLHKNNRYVLEYYLTMSEMGLIYINET